MSENEWLNTTSFFCVAWNSIYTTRILSRLFLFSYRVDLTVIVKGTFEPARCMADAMKNNRYLDAEDLS